MTNNSFIKSQDCQKPIINQTQMYKQRLKSGPQSQVEMQGGLFLFTIVATYYSDTCNYIGSYLYQLNKQRWSRGHKARGQGQGHKKNLRPRPRTAFPRTDPLEAKDINV